MVAIKLTSGFIRKRFVLLDFCGADEFTVHSTPRNYHALKLTIISYGGHNAQC